jgi:hypothetical protein
MLEAKGSFWVAHESHAKPNSTGGEGEKERRRRRRARG